MIYARNLVKNIETARDYIANVSFETVMSTIEAKDKVVFESTIVDDFYNLCREVNYFTLTKNNFKLLRSSFVVALTSTILNYLDTKIEEE